MKIYLASLCLWVLLKYQTLFPEKKLNVLRSFGLLTGEELDFYLKHRAKIASIFLDSGTWTLNNAKAETAEHITRRSFGNYAKIVEPYVDLIANYDSNHTDTGFSENLEHQQELEKMGLKPIPVVHDIYGAEIDYYIEKRYPVVALGSAQIKTVDALAKVMKKFEGREIKVHLFGHAKFDLLANFPLYSCDTAGWAHTGSYGYVRWWNPKKEGENKTDKIYIEEYIHLEDRKEPTLSNYEYRDDLLQYLEETLHVTANHLLGLEGSYYKMLVNTHYHVQLEEIITKIHEEKGFPAFDET